MLSQYMFQNDCSIEKIQMQSPRRRSTPLLAQIRLLSVAICLVIFAVFYRLAPQHHLLAALITLRPQTSASPGSSTKKAAPTPVEATTGQNSVVALPQTPPKNVLQLPSSLDVEKPQPPSQPLPVLTRPSKPRLLSPSTLAQPRETLNHVPKVNARMEQQVQVSSSASISPSPTQSPIPYHLPRDIEAGAALVDVSPTAWAYIGFEAYAAIPWPIISVADHSVRRDLSIAPAYLPASWRNQTAINTGFFTDYTKRRQARERLAQNYTVITPLKPPRASPMPKPIAEEDGEIMEQQKEVEMPPVPPQTLALDPRGIIIDIYAAVMREQRNVPRTYRKYVLAGTDNGWGNRFNLLASALSLSIATNRILLLSRASAMPFYPYIFVPPFHPWLDTLQGLRSSLGVRFSQALLSLRYRHMNVLAQCWNVERSLTQCGITRDSVSVLQFEGIYDVHNIIMDTPELVTEVERRIHTACKRRVAAGVAVAGLAELKQRHPKTPTMADAITDHDEAAAAKTATEAESFVSTLLAIESGEDPEQPSRSTRGRSTSGSSSMSTDDGTTVLPRVITDALVDAVVLQLERLGQWTTPEQAAELAAAAGRENPNRNRLRNLATQPRTRRSRTNTRTTRGKENMEEGNHREIGTHAMAAASKLIAAAAVPPKTIRAGVTVCQAYSKRNWRELVKRAMASSKSDALQSTVALAKLAVPTRRVDDLHIGVHYRAFVDVFRKRNSSEFHIPPSFWQCARQRIKEAQEIMFPNNSPSRAAARTVIYMASDLLVLQQRAQTELSSLGRVARPTPPKFTDDATAVSLTKPSVPSGEDTALPITQIVHSNHLNKTTEAGIQDALGVLTEWFVLAEVDLLISTRGSSFSFTAGDLLGVPHVVAGRSMTGQGTSDDCIVHRGGYIPNTK